MIDTILPVQSKLRIAKIAFLGGARWDEDNPVYIAAFETAKLLTMGGFSIINGGGPGVMHAATKGAHAGGGRALAITYHPNKPKRHYEGVDYTNDFDDEIRTLDYFDRTKVMLQATDAHVVFNGSLGTLSEFGMSWISSWIHDPNRKPIVLYGDFWHGFVDWFKSNMLMEHDEDKMLHICNSPEQVLEYFKEVNGEEKHAKEPSFM